MRIIDRYITRTILVYIAVAALIVLGVDALFAFVRELKHIGDGNYTTLTAMQYIALTLPRRIYNMFPMASLLGAIMGLGMLAGNSELIIMRSAGMSFGRIAYASLKGAFILVLLVSAIGEFIVPKSEHVADVLRASARGSGSAMFTARGVWLKDGNSFIQVGELLPKGHLRSIYRYDFDDQHQLKVASFAEEARLKNNTWHLRNVSRSYISAEKVRNEKVATESWNTKVKVGVLDVMVTEPDELPMLGLYNYIDYLDANELEAEQYWLAFWQKALQPVETLVMVFLAIPFIFGPLRNSSMGLRIVSGIMFGFGFYVLNKMFGPLSIVYDMPPLLGAALPAFIFGLIGIYAMRRIF